MDDEMQNIMRLHEEDLAATRRALEIMDQMRGHFQFQQTEDDTPLSLERAVCHPLLGGTLCIDPAADVPGPSFTVASLRRAILKGDLKCVHHGRLHFVTTGQLRAWITRETDGSTTLVSPPRPPAPPAFSSMTLTLHEKRQGSASVNLALAALDSIGSSNPPIKKRRK
ncbi:hypothetical protein ELI25_04140 [Rhizobium ruizarguesonis]|uniref:hypothetical protein n=1 Tax=Rhizobium ruizarguesonis TaxID=2081791 RepID=UPI0010323956|nr:hypothetical protein [Rhizobium ruizarguesonis]TAW15095.1 hypothetical protein ELI25_04140 [Rhizobium ruizarguesonis]